MRRIRSCPAPITFRRLRRACVTVFCLVLGVFASVPLVQAQTQPLSLSLGQHLSFGTVLRDAGGGTLVLGPFGSLNTSGSVSPRIGGQLVLRVAISGVPNHTVRVTGFPASLALNGPTSGGVSVDTWVPTLSNVLDIAGAQIPANGGPQPVEIGATLRVSGNALAGGYTGMVTLQAYDLQNSALSNAVTGFVSVDIGYAITAAPVQDLSFGRLAVAGAGSLCVNPSGSFVPTGALSVLSRSTPMPAIVSVRGTPNAPVSVSLPTSVNLWGGLNHLLLDTLAMDIPGTGRLDGAGALTFRLGGTLRLSEGQATGPYSGVVVVTVSYD